MPIGVYKRTKPAWNKGLTKEDPRVRKQLETREKNPNWRKNHKIGCKNNKYPSRKGAKHSEATKKKSGIKPKDFSERMRKSYENNPQLRELRSKTTKRRYELNPELREIQRNRRYNQIFPKKDTVIETMLQNELIKRGIKFITHPNIDGIAQPDIVIPEDNLVIFADGCYWHSCPDHHPNGKGKGNEERTNKKLEERGYRVIRFWGHEILESPKDCIDRTMRYAEGLGKPVHLELI